MDPLAKPLRKQLEDAVIKARDIAEDAARSALLHLGVGEASLPKHLTDGERALRRRLRAHGRQLGDHRDPDGQQAIEQLAQETAYEHWHRMLFARFLAENSLLMHPEGVALSLAECQELAQDEGAANGWELAGRYAARMLPQIFRPDSPVLALDLAPEHQRALERLLAELAPETFHASDSLGWVYQFWQTRQKERVNDSEVKIGARELPAVTQLFTEPYMVAFLLDNSLGAWWAARRLSEDDRLSAETEAALRRKAAIPGVPLEYLRFSRSLPSPSGRGAGGEGSKPLKLPPDILEHARELRRNQTDAEALLWGLLRSRRFLDKKFRRQHPVGRYILDFYCHNERLGIELDGGQHNEAVAQAYDQERIVFLQRQGIRVLRFWNNDVLSATESVLEALWQTLAEEDPHPKPLSQGERGLEGARRLWSPAAGTFDAWPAQLGELKLMDPCCGSGHFLVAALQMLVPMRMALEGLDARSAVDAVLRDNLHGLELDQRCVEIAAFALALTAWRYPKEPLSLWERGRGEGEPLGYRPLPALNLACSGLGIHASKADWLQLAEGDVDLQHALERIYELFQDAPTLGSLIDPRRAFRDDLIELGPQRGWERVAPLVERALASEDEQQRELGVVAAGLARAAQLLADRYQCVITNVPYLARGKQQERLRDFCERHHSEAKNDLATVFLERCLGLCVEGGTASVVLPQNWLFLSSYRKLREKLLKQERWHLIARLGPGAFETISGEVVKAILLSLSRGNAVAAGSDLLGDAEADPGHLMRGVDVSEYRTAAEKAGRLLAAEIKSVGQVAQLGNPDSLVMLDEASDALLLGERARSLQGLGTGDDLMYSRCFWELLKAQRPTWKGYQGPAKKTKFYSGRNKLIYWEDGKGSMQEQTASRIQGLCAWGKRGVSVQTMKDLNSTLYSGDAFDMNASIIVPDKEELLPAIWSYASSKQFLSEVRKINQKLRVADATLVKVPFDLAYWQQVAAERYPNGLPKPYSDDPTQWIFHGHPCASVIWDETSKWTAIGPKRTDESVLQVAVARLLGYRWPAEEPSPPAPLPRGEGSEDGAGSDGSPSPSGRGVWGEGLSDESRQLLAEARQLDALSDDDGIVCLPALRGEPAAHERLLNLLIAAYGEDWTTGTLSALLQSAGAAGKSLEVWLRDHFFEQHCKRFHHRPFIWHLWDGLKDGFAALVNYHQLDRAKLERLIYTYLDDWIRLQQRAAAEGGTDGAGGADERLAAARALKTKLEAILDGEAPLDIFVRWKPLAEQPIGWNPDLNDGVRLNIRPFLLAGDVGKKGAGVLRAKPNIKWTKDRGKDVESAPWFAVFNGERINDHHLTLAEKRVARDQRAEGAAR